MNCASSRRYHQLHRYSRLSSIGVSPDLKTSGSKLNTYWYAEKEITARGRGASSLDLAGLSPRIGKPVDALLDEVMRLKEKSPSKDAGALFGRSFRRVLGGGAGSVTIRIAGM